MKPGDHPEFFRFPAPEGRSRESEIRLDAEGHFHDHGERVEHARSWSRRCTPGSPATPTTGGTS